MFCILLSQNAWSIPLPEVIKTVPMEICKKCVIKRKPHFSAMSNPMRRLLRAHGNSTFRRAAYIFCATLFTCTLFTGIIILYLVVLPYLHEHEFEESLCELAEIERERPIIKCENRCSRERSRFPCLRVRVTYKKNNANYSATLFDTIETHERYRRYKVHFH